MMGEYGGASSLAWRAIQLISLAWSQRGPQTALTDLFLEASGESTTEALLEKVALDDWYPTAALAPQIAEIAAAGDSVAQSLFVWAGESLASLGIGVIHQLSLEDDEFQLVFVGGLLRGNDVVRQTAQDCIHAVAPGAEFVQLTAHPVLGAVLLGMEAAERPGWHIRDALRNSLQTLG
jgi:glucosamine kinase